MPVLAAFRPKASLIVENLALRQQLAVLRRTVPRPRIRPADRAFWALLSRTWSRWVDALVIVKPATVVGWHRRGFARFWAKKSEPVGRPPLAAEVVTLIERMVAENPLYVKRPVMWSFGDGNQPSWTLGLGLLHITSREPQCSASTLTQGGRDARGILERTVRHALGRRTAGP
jgi:hypothetical protein